MAGENKKFLTISHLKQLLSSLKQRFTAIENKLERKSNISDLADVATTGSYNDLIDKPSGVDWNANENQQGYIQNRPFYKEIHQEVIAEEQTIREDYSYGWVSLTYVNGFSGFNDNETIIVTIDNEQYFLNAIKENDYSQYVEGYDKTDNYFKIFYNSDSLYYIAEKVHGLKTISIAKNIYTYHKLDSNYIDTENTIATHTYVNNALATKVNSADLATVATTGDYDDLSNKPTIPTVPTNVSSFANDAGYLTQHQSLTGYATEQWVGQQGYLTSYTETDPTVPAWAKASTKPSYTASEVGALPSTTVIPSKTSDITNDSGFVTQEDVKEQILSDDYTEEKVPYLYREAPYSVASVEEKIVGGTVGWNQMVQNPTDYSLSTKGLAQGTVITSGHKCLVTLSSKVADSSVSSSVFLYVKQAGEIVVNGVQLFNASLKTASIWGSTVNAVADGSVNTDNSVWIYVSNPTNVTDRAFNFIDLTTLFGSTIADYIYSLEQSTAGAGVAKLKEWGFFTEDYYEYCEPTLKSVEGLQSKVTRDADENIIATYPLDSTLTLRGIPKLDSSNNLYYDGDAYESDGTVRRSYTERAYQSGDESLADAITDGTTTVVKLATPTTFTAQPYRNPQIVGDTEEWVTTGIVPVGHETKCYAGTMNLINSKADKTTTYTKTEVDTALSAKAGTAVATTSANGLMSSTDKSRLDDLYADYSSALTALGVN